MLTTDRAPTYGFFSLHLFGKLSLSLLILSSSGSQVYAADEAKPQDAAVVIEVTAHESPTDRGSAKGRASSKVTRQEMDEQLPRSAPDALRYEPGVFVQQSAHGQGSPFLRGRTGQQTVMLFDGIRMNTSLYRQGPNQYFFTLDAKTLKQIEVIRGGASTRYGSDAIGGVIDARPIEPSVNPMTKRLLARPRASLRFGSADTDFGHRFQIDAQLGPKLRFLFGAGHRVAGRLESAGAVRSPQTGAIPLVPVFEDDQRTQLGTGFRELTADGRFVVGLPKGRRLVAAAYLYRQYDSPRTDQCPAPYAPLSECLLYNEQFRSLAYLSLEGDLGSFARFGRLSVSYQRQHERRTYDRPESFVQNIGRDAVDTLGLTLKVTGHETRLGKASSLRVDGGADLYLDFVESRAWTSFTDIDAVLALSRGQYVDGARYAHGGVFAEAEASVYRRLLVRLGGRGAFAQARAAADTASGTQAVAATWPVVVGHVGAELSLTDTISLLTNIDRSYRAPNLDDLTSRQQSGPGFQFENPNLRPEQSLTYEVGMRLSSPRIELDAFGYYSTMQDAISRSLRTIADCPPETPQCGTSWSRFQLVNLKGNSFITGFEVSFRASMPFGLSLRAMAAYAYGSAPNPESEASETSSQSDPRVPISRVPPLNGSAELRWAIAPGAYLGAATRWATLQDRLAPTDRTDARIPDGGTPGFVVLDLRAGYRMQRDIIVATVIENIFDMAYRWHGSSVNGAGRGIIVNIEAGL